MIDLLIRNGLVVDGTGSPAFPADVAISGDRIVAVGEVDCLARRTLDAEDRVVAPGWVDIHTHYDGQVTWDQELAPTSINGVTSVVMGNCGVGFAPVRPGQQEWLIGLLEGVEDIPGTALSEGITWGWETFPEYLYVLDRMHWTIDVGTQLPHAALRTYVMGDRGADHRACANRDEIARMSALAEAAIRAGALGFTTSRTWGHRARTGSHIGTLAASTDEVLGIVSALSRAGAGVVQLVSDVYHSADDELVEHELELLGSLTRAGRPVSFTVQQSDETPDRFRQLLGAIESWSQTGAVVRGQVGVRAIGLLLGLATSVCPLTSSASYMSLRDLPLPERVARLHRPEVRQRILAEHAASSVAGIPALIHSAYHRMFRLTDPPDYEPSQKASIAGIAAVTGRQPSDVLYDMLLEDCGTCLVYLPLMNYARGNLDDVREMIASPYSILGLSDAGAHCNTICDASLPTTAISHWTRDRTRGEKLSLEYMVHQQTQRTAAHVGWQDRGVLKPGYLADLNIVDPDTIAALVPRVVADLPGGGTRLMQPARGYVVTVKRGVPIVEDGDLTGERPGRLQRGPRPSPG